MTAALLVWLFAWSPSALQATAPQIAKAVTVPAPRPGDTCPVCGMFVAKYPQWVATVVWRDGSVAHFDGAKDLFTYVLQLPKYAPGRSPKDLVTIAVTEFYDVRRIDAREAYYVVGSDVLGPMGREFIPLASQADADEFSKDHHGVRILRFSDVTLQTVQQVDAGVFDVPAGCDGPPCFPPQLSDTLRQPPGSVLPWTPSFWPGGSLPLPAFTTSSSSR